MDDGSVRPADKLSRRRGQGRRTAAFAFATPRTRYQALAAPLALLLPVLVVLPLAQPLLLPLALLLSLALAQPLSHAHQEPSTPQVVALGEPSSRQGRLSRAPAGVVALPLGQGQGLGRLT